MRKFIVTLLCFATLQLCAQHSYSDSISNYIADYVKKHEVVQGDDKRKMQFYKPDSAYKVVARFAPATNTAWIKFKTSGSLVQTYKLYGTAHFMLKGKSLQLNVYQSQELATVPQYKNYLFLPFTDATSGAETYAGGRYFDFYTEDIKSDTLVIDFNKAYNPYCAYLSGKYNCPIPPKENALEVAVIAGEKAYTGKH